MLYIVGFEIDCTFRKLRFWNHQGYHFQKKSMKVKKMAFFTKAKGKMSKLVKPKVIFFKIEMTYGKNAPLEYSYTS